MIVFQKSDSVATIRSEIPFLDRWIRVEHDELGLYRIEFATQPYLTKTCACPICTQIQRYLSGVIIGRYHGRDSEEFDVLCFYPSKFPVSYLSIYQHLITEVPYASTISYSGLAIKAGYPAAVGRISAYAARAVGSAMRRNPWPIVVPCHRVVSIQGAIGNYQGGTENKKFLLDLEAKFSHDGSEVFFRSAVLPPKQPMA